MTARKKFRMVPGGSNLFLVVWLLLALSSDSTPAAEVTAATPNPPSLPEVTFDRPSGFCLGAFNLTLATSVRNATIFYTTNGENPSPAALRYQGSIPISTTTIVRAAAFVNNVAVTAPATRTYLFASDILKQTGAGFPNTWGTSAGWTVPSHYTMTMSDNDQRQLVIAGLRAIPSLSIVTAAQNLFGDKTGIYTHPKERGSDWERPASVELLDTPGQTGFHINCGIRIHGGLSRSPEESPKHSFRLGFKPRYGSAPLRFPLFGPDGAQEFDGLVLRAGNNNSWLDSNGAGRQRAEYLRDEWMRRSMLEMGHPSPRGRFVHLYLNGIYWGVYNLCERPSAAWLATREGRPASDYDFRKADEIESGDAVAWNQMIALANSGVSDARGYQKIGQQLDLPEFVDYLILNLYAGNSDWDRSANWCAARPRIPGGKFQFFVWDAERTLEELETDSTDFDDDECPPRLFHKLSENAEFRALFAARVRQLLFDGGALSPEASARRYQALVATLENAITAEAARWGTYRRHVHQYKSGPFENYTLKDHWQPETQRILTRYFPERRRIFLDQLRERGLFPPDDASQTGATR